MHLLYLQNVKCTTFQVFKDKLLRKRVGAISNWNLLYCPSDWRKGNDKEQWPKIAEFSALHDRGDFITLLPGDHFMSSLDVGSAENPKLILGDF
jgi:hypothetical protein